MAFAALVVDLTAKLTNLQQGMDRAVKIAEDSGKKIEKAFSFGGAARAGAGFFAAQLGLEKIRDALTTLKNVQDEWTRVGVLITNVTERITDAERAQTRLFEVAQATRQNFGATVGVFASLARNSQELNITSEQAIRLQQTISQAIALSGARADSAASALVQFGQGLASGVLRGEELNSVLEQTPRLAKALAEGLGVSTGQLLKLGKEGELTASRIITALEKVAPKLAEEFEKAVPTFDDVITKMTNSVGNLLNRINEIAPIWDTIKNTISGAADALDRLVQLSRFDAGTTDRVVRQTIEGQLKSRQQQFFNYQAIAEGEPGRISDESERKRLESLFSVNPRKFNREMALAAQSIDKLRESLVELGNSQAAQGLNSDGSPRVPLPQIEANAIARLSKDIATNTTKYQEFFNVINGVDKALAGKLQVVFERRQLALAQEGLPDFEAGGARADERLIYSQAAYESDVKRILETSGLIKKAKTGGGGPKIDPLAPLIRDGEKLIDTFDKWREKILEAVDPTRELYEELKRIDRLESLGSGVGLSVEQAISARADVEAKLKEARDKFEKSSAFVGPSFSVTEDYRKAKESLDKYLESMRIEADLIGLTDAQREARTKLLDAEAVGLARGSAEWERYRSAIENASKQKRLAEIDQMRGGAFDSRTADIQLLTERLQQQLDESDFLGLDTSKFVDQYTAAVQAILGLNGTLKDDTYKLGEAFSSAFEKAVLEAGKMSDVVRGLIKDIAALFLRQQITGPLAAAINSGAKGALGGTTLFDSLVSLGSSLFGRADGGLVGKGQAYLVGERGVPELFTPNQSGRITPLSKLGGAPTVVNNNYFQGGEVSRNDLVNAQAQSEARMKAWLMDNAMRNGPAARVVR